MCRRSCNNNASALLFVLLQLLASQTNGFGRPRSHKQPSIRNSVQAENDCSNSRASSKNSSPVEKGPTSAPTDLDPHYKNCGLVGFGVVQKIPYQITPSYGRLEVNLSSACIRCGICIAIVERINQTLMNVHYVMDTNEWFNETETHLFLSAVCDDGFRHYALREIDGECYIGDSNTVPGTTSVMSNVDGLWESILKNKCHDILDDVGPRQLYKHWQDWCNDKHTAKPLIETLCRNADSGRLRDCQNMDCDPKKCPAAAAAAAAAANDPCGQSFDWRARAKVTTQLNLK